MARKRLNITHRHKIIDWMIDAKIKKIETNKELNKLLLKVIQKINPILRKKYPEEDMIVLRKYKFIRTDSCLKFSTPEGGLFTIDFAWRYSGAIHEISKQQLLDIPSTGGCNNQIVFEGTNELRDLYSDFEKLYDELKQNNHNKREEYRSFVFGCKYLDEIEEIIILPEDIRKLINGVSTSLTILNKELVQSIKKDFAK